MTSASRPWTIRQAGRDDLAALGRLFEDCFGFSRDPSHVEWKFFDNPVGRPLLTVAEAAGKLVGQYALWPVELRLGGEVVLGAQSLDTMTHPDFRGQGMFPRLARACMETAESTGVKVLYGFPNANSYAGFVRKLNWDHTGDVPFYARPLHPSRHPRIPSGLGLLADGLSALLPRGGGRGVLVLDEEPSPEERVTLWNGDWLPSADMASIARSAAWERWRFAPASRMQYRWVATRDAGRLTGYAVWATDLRSSKALLSELCGTDQRTLNALVAAVVSAARASSHSFLTTATTIPAVQGALARNGFVRHTRLPLIVRTLTSRLLRANVHRHDVWQLVGADLDTF